MLHHRVNRPWRLLAPYLLVFGAFTAAAQAPLLTGAIPAANARASASTTNVVLTFDQPMSGTSGEALRVFSAQAGGRKAGTADVSGNTLRFAPAAAFKPGELVRVTLTNAATSAAGDPVDRPQVRQFTIAAGLAAGIFEGTTEVISGAGASGLATGDIDADGDLDLLVVNGMANSVSLRRNDGSASFSGPDTLATGFNPSGLVLADVDTDGDLDLLVANLYSNAVTVHPNDGTGHFAGPVFVPVGDGPAALNTADIDADGDLDLLTANALNNSVSVCRNDGSGHFADPEAIAVGLTPLNLTTGDIDGDGDLDLLVANFDDNTISVLHNDGAGHFGLAPSVRVSTGPVSVALADIDGDGDLDLLAPTYTSSTVSVRLNAGNGTFGAGSDPRMGDHPVALAVADADGDGDLDILTANAAASTVWLRPNNGAGAFGSISGTAVGPGPVGISLADLDGDGDLDLLTPNNSANSVSVRLNRARLAIISSFSPASGEVGTAVTISGQYFAGATAVRFGGIPAMSYVVNSSTSITAIVPPGVSLGRLSVTTAGGNALSVGSFTPLRPVVSSFTAGSAAVGATVSVTGANLANATAVTFNGVAASFAVISATTLIATVPPLATTGKISVTTPTGTGTSAGSFRVLPTIGALSPLTGAPGTLVTLTGSGFTDVSSVKFNNVLATRFTIASATSISVEVPAAATSGKIMITNAGGSASSAASFAVAPSVSSFTPVQGASGSVVIVSGYNFASGTTVSFSGINAVTTYHSATQLTAVVPAGATTGLLTVSNGTGTTNSATNFRVTAGPAPTITALTPTTGVGPGTVITITGANLASTTDVRFGIYSASTFTVVSATKLLAIVPPMAVSGRVYAVGPTGMAQSTGSLTILPPAAITDFTPGSGSEGTVVTVTGTNFTSASSVSFNGVRAATTYNSTTQLTAVVPAGAATGLLTVTTAAGTVAAAAVFSVAVGRPTPPPAPAAEKLLPALALYPNPARELVHVAVDDDRLPVQLCNAIGRVVTSCWAKNGEATLALTGLPKGLYLVRCGGTARRLIVE